MSVSSNNSARRWPAELRAWGGFRWQQFRSWQTYRRAWGGSWYRFRSGLTRGRDRRTWDGHWWERFRSGLSYGRADTVAFAASVILGSAALVGFLTMGRGSAPAVLGEAFTVGVTDEGVPYVALDPEGLGQGQDGAPKDGGSSESDSSAVPVFFVDTSGDVLSFIGVEGSSVGSDPSLRLVQIRAPVQILALLQIPALVLRQDHPPPRRRLQTGPSRHQRARTRRPRPSSRRSSRRSIRRSSRPSSRPSIRRSIRPSSRPSIRRSIRRSSRRSIRPSIRQLVPSGRRLHDTKAPEPSIDETKRSGAAPRDSLWTRVASSYRLTQRSDGKDYSVADRRPTEREAHGGA